MASYVTPKKNTAFIIYVSLEDQANAGKFKASPTIASGDFKVSIDGGALANLATLPTNTPSGSVMVKISLSADEMNGDNITVACIDAAGAEWYDLALNIQTTAQQIDDIPTASDNATAAAAAILATPANKLATDANGVASANVTLWAGDGVNDAIDGYVPANVYRHANVAVTAADANGNIPVDVVSSLGQALSQRLVEVFDTVIANVRGIQPTGNSALPYPVATASSVSGKQIALLTPVSTNVYGWSILVLSGTYQYYSAVVESVPNSTTLVMDRVLPAIDYGTSMVFLPPGGAAIDGQDVADALLLAPSGVAATGSAMDYLADIVEDTGTTLPELIAAISQTVASTTDSTAAGSIARRRGDSWSISLTIGSITGYTSLWFTAKWDRDNTDAESVLQIKKNASGSGDGLLYVNGAAAANAALGSITVTDASTGAIVIAVDETVTDDLPPAGIYYDVQALISGSVSTLDSGTLTISADVTRAVA